MMAEEGFYKKIKEALKEKSMLERQDIDQIIGDASKPSEHHVDYSIVKTTDGEIYEISTVFMDYWGKIGRSDVSGEVVRQFDKISQLNPEAKPYETMVFKLEDVDKIDLVRLHYDSKEDAQKGHKVITRLMWEHGPDLIRKLKLSEDEPWWRKY